MINIDAICRTRHDLEVTLSKLPVKANLSAEQLVLVKVCAALSAVEKFLTGAPTVVELREELSRTLSEKFLGDLPAQAMVLETAADIMREIYNSMEQQVVTVQTVLEAACLELFCTADIGMLLGEDLKETLKEDYLVLASAVEPVIQVDTLIERFLDTETYVIAPGFNFQALTESYVRYLGHRTLFGSEASAVQYRMSVLADYRGKCLAGIGGSTLRDLFMTKVVDS